MYINGATAQAKASAGNARRCPDEVNLFAILRPGSPGDLPTELAGTPGLSRLHARPKTLFSSQEPHLRSM
jgi:hypothetical protein